MTRRRTSASLLTRLILLLITVAITYSIAYLLFFSPNYKSQPLVNFDDFALGEWQWEKPLYRFYENDILKIRQDPGDQKKHLHALINSEKLYTGFGIDGYFDVPEKAILKLTWRARGSAPAVQIDFIDGSPAVKEGWPAGEIFSFYCQQPPESWQTIRLPLENFKREESQPVNRPNDGVMDLLGAKGIQFTFMPGSKIELELREIAFERKLSGIGLLILLEIMLIAGLVFLFWFFYSPALTFKQDMNKKQAVYLRIALSILAIITALTAVSMSQDLTKMTAWLFFSLILIPLLLFFDELQEVVAGLGAKERKKKYEQSKLSQDKTRYCLNKLDQMMTVEKKYLDSELSLKSLSENLEVNTTYLSQIINEHLGKNFNDYINHYRVQEAKDLILDPKEKKINLTDIAFQSGFNSIPSFNRVFKKMTGFNPSQFCKTYKKNINEKGK